MNTIYQSSKFLCCIIFLFIFGTVSATAQRTCASHEHLHELENQTPAVKANRAEIEKFTAAYIKKNGGIKDRAAAYNIPVVVHIVYNANVQNITDAQVYSQIAVLNADTALSEGMWLAGTGSCQIRSSAGTSGPR